LWAAITTNAADMTMMYIRRRTDPVAEPADQRDGEESDQRGHDDDVGTQTLLHAWSKS